MIHTIVLTYEKRMRSIDIKQLDDMSSIAQAHEKSINPDKKR